LICLAEPHERQSLAEEYWEGFSEINEPRTAQKAKHAEDLFREKDRFSAQIFSVLQDVRLFKIKSSLNKKNRKTIEQKWSFSQIIEHLSDQHARAKPVAHIKSLLHIYGMASHLAHADRSALDLMIDRAARGANERLILEQSHACRIFSDQVWLSFFSAEVLRTAFEEVSTIQLKWWKQ
jgi:hypothetical protein